jgi:predicted TIM-barrel fold metal-dependent hydrolase
MFGTGRLIYASNWPVSELFASLATVESIIKTYFDAQGPDATRHVFCRSSAAAYRWRWRHPTGR